MLWVLPPVLLGIVVLVWLAGDKQAPVRAERGEPTRTVRVIEVPQLDLIPIAEGYGPVEPARVWAAVSEVKGPVVEIHPRLRDGEILTEGTELLRVDPVDYELALAQSRAELAELDVQEQNARASLTIEERNLLLARQDLERKRKLVQQGTTSESAVDEAQMAMSSLRRLFIGRPEIKVDFTRLSEQLPQLLGFSPLVRLDLGNYLSEWEAEFVRFSDAVDAKTRTMGVVVAVDRPFEKIVPGYRPPLSKGMFVQVVLRGSSQGPRLVVPRSAVRGGAVYVADGEHRLRRRAVEVLFDQGQLSVVAAGLEPGGREGIGTATAVMREGADMTRFLDDVKSEVDAIDDFPAASEPPVIEELGRTEPVISIAVTGPDDPVALKACAEALKDQLLALENIAEVAINGFSDHHIRIEVPAWRLRQYGLSAAEAADVVGRHSVGSPAGRLEGASEDLLLRFDDQRKSAEAFRDLLVISGETGAAIRLGEVARISDRFDRDEEKILFNGSRAAVLDVAKTRAQDILEVLATVETFVAGERERAPRGVDLTLTQDRASVVQDRLDMLVRNGAQGLVLVFLLPLLGVTINMISMVGLLIGIGLLMDDAIVIAENIAARLSKGDTPMHAAIEGARQVLPGVLSSFATTLLVFGSLAFVTGEIGQILRIMPIVLILVISVSLLESFWILPHHLGIPWHT